MNSKSVAIDYIDHQSESYSFLADPSVDALMQVVLEIGSELWVSRQRTMILEKALIARGALSEQELESFEPSASVRAEFVSERDRMISAIYDALRMRLQPANQAAQRAKDADPPMAKPIQREASA
jgi:hypothetical protein